MNFFQNKDGKVASIIRYDNEVPDAQCFCRLPAQDMLHGCPSDIRLADKEGRGKNKGTGLSTFLS